MAAQSFGRRGVVSRPSMPATASPTLAEAAANVDTGPYSQAEVSAAIARLTASSLPQWAKVTFRQNVYLTLYCGLALAALWIVESPDLMRDVRLAGTYRVDLGIKVDEGRCRDLLFVAQLCSVSYSWNDAGVTTAGSTYFMTSLTATSKVPLVPVRSKEDTDAISVAFAVKDKLTNRVAGFGVWTVLLIAGAMTGLLRLASGRYAGGRAFHDFVNRGFVPAG